MEKNRENCYEIAKQIYQLDKEAYECVGSSLGRTFTGDEAVVTLDKYNFTKGFWGTNGITVKNGFTTPEIKMCIRDRSGGIKWDCHRSTDKSYPGDNRLITPKSSHRRSGLAPRCRLIASWGCSRSQGLGCSPIKAVRELGSERRETVRSLSGVGVGYLRGAALSTRGPGWTGRWWICCITKCIAE